MDRLQTRFDVKVAVAAAPAYPAIDSNRLRIRPIRQMPDAGMSLLRMETAFQRDDLDSDRPPYSRLVAGVLLLVAVGGAIDLFTDRPRSWLSLHVMVEVALLVLSLTFAILLWRAWGRANVQLVQARRTIADRQAERDAWRESAETALAGLGAALERQFDAWGLTAAEREVALHLLKGHGHKQIAARTGRSERTVRQHAVSVYGKSGLSGRAELAAFFLESLMLPDDAPSRGHERGARPA